MSFNFTLEVVPTTSILEIIKLWQKEAEGLA
jgi:hypothetical protein